MKKYFIFILVSLTLVGCGTSSSQVEIQKQKEIEVIEAQEQKEINVLEREYQIKEQQRIDEQTRIDDCIQSVKAQALEKANDTYAIFGIAPNATRSQSEAQLTDYCKVRMATQNTSVISKCVSGSLDQLNSALGEILEREKIDEADCKQ